MLNAPQVKPSCLPSLQANIHNVGIHYMSPGMVNTGLLMAGPHSAVTKMFINCLGEGRAEGAGPGGRGGGSQVVPNRECGLAHAKAPPLTHPLLFSSNPPPPLPSPLQLIPPKRWQPSSCPGCAASRRTA